MDEAAEGFLAAGEDIGVVLADFAHFLGRDLGVVQRRRPLRGALEHGQVARGLGDFRDGLDAGGAGADHRDALARKTDRFLGPVMRVAGLALEALDAGNARQNRRRQHADRGDQEARGAMRAVVERDLPASAVFLVMRRGHCGFELDVAPEVELVGDVVQIPFGFRLAGEMLLPVPFVEQFLRKGVAVGPTFGVKPGAGITVPVPGAADTGAGLEHPRRQAKFAQAVELIEAGNPGADDDRVEIGGQLCGWLARGFHYVVHAHLSSRISLSAPLVVWAAPPSHVGSRRPKVLRAWR